MKPTLYWIKGPWPGRLAIAARPRGGDWLEDEIKACKEAGVDVVVSTLEPEEDRALDLGAEARITTDSGMEFVSLPIADRQTPNSIKQEDLLRLEMQLRHARNLIVHCRQGIGRSAMIAAALLILAGLEAEKALQVVQEARLAPVPETEEQKDWIKRFGERQSLARTVK